MTVDEYLEGRDAFDSKRSVRNRRVALAAREDLRARLIKNASRMNRRAGWSPSEAAEKAANETAAKLTALAALHIPDMVAGGKDVIGDFGDRKINSRIGAQWKNGGRLRALDVAANEVPQSLRSMTKMNARLERCK